MAAEVLAHAGKGLRSPAYDDEGQLHVVSYGSGSVLSVADGACHEVANTAGQPSGVAWQEGQLFIADQAHGAILTLDESGEHTIVVSEYEGKAFRGPNSITFDSAGSMYFTDSGPLGETTLGDPKGSLFVVGPDELLRPVVHESLAHPSGVAVAPGDKAVYVAETLANRILRIVQAPAGVHHVSVFHQFAGRLGPVAVACDAQRGGCLYVAHFDFEGASPAGLLTVLSSEGKVLKEVPLGGPEVSGVTISPDGSTLVVTDSGANTISQIPLSEVHA